MTSKKPPAKEEESSEEEESEDEEEESEEAESEEEVQPATAVGGTKEQIKEEESAESEEGIFHSRSVIAIISFKWQWVGALATSLKSSS